MPINDTLESLKAQLSGSINTVLPSKGIPSFTSAEQRSAGQRPSSLTSWTELTFYPEGGPRPGRTIGRGGQAGETWVLPLPQDLSDVNSFEYESVEFGGITMLIDSAYNALTLGMDKGNTTGAEDNATFGREVGETAFAAGTLALDAIGAENARNGVRAKFRKTANPNLESLFKSSNLRTFQFSWSITPLSRQDSDSLKQFISNFKKAIYPDNNGLLATANAAQLMSFPNEFVVSFYSTGVDVGSKLIFTTAACACTDFTVQYTPNGAFNTHIDGRPTSISINATFQEMYALTRNDIVAMEP